MTRQQVLSPKSILVRMPNWLGDLVMSTPVLADLRHQWPQAKITAMCQGQVGTLLTHDPHIDACFNFQRPRGWLKHGAHQEIIAPLRHGHYDLGILLTNSLSSAWWLWRGDVQHRLGYATHWRRWLLNHPVSVPPEKETQHLVKTYKGLLEPLGIPLSDTPPRLYVTEQEKQMVKESLSQLGIEDDHILIGINPGAAYGSAKCWLPERFEQVIQKLLDHPRICILCFGDKGGAPLVDAICAKIQAPERVINLAGRTTLRELLAFIHACHLFLTNDSGPMHIASALGIPLVALFGSTNDRSTGPYQGGTVIHKHVECSPCYRRTCPIDFRCMKQIEVQEVYQELHKMIYSLENKRS